MKGAGQSIDSIESENKKCMIIPAPTSFLATKAPNAGLLHFVMLSSSVSPASKRLHTSCLIPRWDDILTTSESILKFYAKFTQFSHKTLIFSADTWKVTENFEIIPYPPIRTSDWDLSYPKLFLILSQNGDLAALELQKASKSCLRFIQNFLEKKEAIVSGRRCWVYTIFFPQKYYFFRKNAINMGADLSLSCGCTRLVLVFLTSLGPLRMLRWALARVRLGLWRWRSREFIVRVLRENSVDSSLLSSALMRPWRA